MSNSILVYIFHSELADQQGKLTGLNLCEVIDQIMPGQTVGSQLINGIWSIWLRTRSARDKLAELKHIEIDNIRIEIYTEYPTCKPVPNEKIIFKDLPLWVSDTDVIKFLEKQPGIIIKTGVISARLRDHNNKLTQYYSGDRFVFVKGNFSPVLHNSAIIENHKCRIFHKSQEQACSRCRKIGHAYTNTAACDAYHNDPNVITIRSPKFVLCNYYSCHLKFCGKEFNSSEQAYQWRFMKHIGMDSLATEILASQTPEDAKDIASRVPRHLHRDWHRIKIHAMKEILHAKADYCPTFKQTLIDSLGKRLAESTRDLFWATGLSPRDTATTLPSFYPGNNTLGFVLELVRTELLKEIANIASLQTDAPDEGAIQPNNVNILPPSSLPPTDVLQPATNVIHHATSVNPPLNISELPPPPPSLLVDSNTDSDSVVSELPFDNTSTTEDIELTMSGVEELLHESPPLNVVHTEQVSSEHPAHACMSDQDPDKLKRKISPQKDADTTRDYVKQLRRDSYES